MRSRGKESRAESCLNTTGLAGLHSHVWGRLDRAGMRQSGTSPLVKARSRGARRLGPDGAERGGPRSRARWCGVVRARTPSRLLP